MGKNDMVRELEALKKRTKVLEEALRGSNCDPFAGCSELKKQLKIAARIHQTLLPGPCSVDLADVDVRYYPMDEVGGDYCQVRFTDSKDACYVAACDVTGHGIGSAMLATRISSEVRRYMMEDMEPGEMVGELNDFIMDYFSDINFFPSFFGAKIDLTKRKITWSGAGHPCPLLIKGGGEDPVFLRSQNSLIGVNREILGEAPEHTETYPPRSRLVIYSDGITDAMDTEERVLGPDGLSRIVSEAMKKGLFEMADDIIEQVERYRNGPKTDDEFLLVMEMK